MGTDIEIVVISLVKATERRRYMSAMLGGFRRKWSFFDAHETLQHPGLRYDPVAIKRTYGRSLSTAQIAVCSSHAAVLSRFVESGPANYILVMEDDIIFDVEFPLGHLVDICISNSIHYIRLFGKHYAEAVRLGFFYDRSIVRFTTTPTGGQAYLMSKTGARMFLDSFRLIDTALDLGMDSFWRTNLPIYSVFPYPIIERFTPTSIPILAPSPLGFIQTSQRLLQRAIGKTRKAVANIAMRSADMQLHRSLAGFRQVETTDLGTA